MIFPRPCGSQRPCVIAGGESGPSARSAHPDWFRFVRDRGASAGVPFLFKQHGAWLVSESADESALFS
ncbi:MAG: DUF5131 family protein [Acidobacteriaceae bacterium]|nr:DUF5131 family protein [Acidobacteriaceae bacterium]